MPAALRELGMAASTSLLTVCWTFALWTSTIGVSPVTVIVSSSAPTFSSPLTVATNVPESSMPSRLTVLKPGSENVTEYVPGRRSTIRYWPVSSLTTERTFSISAGLAASTVTPGNTPPDASLTTPVMAACANAAAGNKTTADNARTHRPTNFRICAPPPPRLWVLPCLKGSLNEPDLFDQELDYRIFCDFSQTSKKLKRRRKIGWK